MDGLFDRIYEVVRGIPAGNVMNYGTVARLAGSPRCARQVGWALHVNPDPEHIPCHRVVMKDGSVSPAFAFGGEDRQRWLLEREGVEFVNGKVDMQRFAIKI